MSNWGFILLAYALTWVVIAGYALYLRSRERQASAALEAARRAPEAER